jgi:hypothetical protein
MCKTENIFFSLVSSHAGLKYLVGQAYRFLDVITKRPPYELSQDVFSWSLRLRSLDDMSRGR